jgi:hypothetical protein
MFVTLVLVTLFPCPQLVWPESVKGREPMVTTLQILQAPEEVIVAVAGVLTAVDPEQLTIHW